MSDEASDVEERIINATLACIEQYGLTGATIRNIAAIAGVNSAAINYYFRSKNTLIRRALDRSLQHAFDWGDFAASERATARERLVHILTDLMAGARRFPRISRAHLEGRDGHPEDREKAIAAIGRFLHQLERDLEERGVHHTGGALRSRLLQVFSASILAAMSVPDLFNEYGYINVDDEVSRLDYVGTLVDRIFFTPERD
ncbi:MAG: TetR/AcrR family transcriptional regulator [Spirochaetota bacterium]